MRQILLIIFLSFGVLSYGQNNKAAIIQGKVTDAVSGEPVDFVTVFIEGSSNATETNLNGKFSLRVNSHEEMEISFSRVGYKKYSHHVNPLKSGGSIKIDVSFVPEDSDIEVIVTESKIEGSGAIREDVSELKLLPTTTGNLEAVLPHIALGTSSGTGGELSSQYNVRGGNYDENLVYVNDFEIYRPQLIRTGQQEGLSFPNMDMIRDLEFHSGGYGVNFGDKMSSVLNIRYKLPDSLRASIGLSLLGGSAHLEGSKKLGKENYRRFRYLLGARYKTTKYILGSLDVVGEYTPNFADIQTYLTYDLNPELQLGLLANYNRSDYNFIPKTGSSAFGLINYTLNLYTVFDGAESDKFENYMGGLSLTYLPNRRHNPYYLKFLVSTYQAFENENIDILGHYLLGEVDTNLGSENAGEIVNILGTGTQHQYIRNLFVSNVTAVEHKGGIELELNSNDDSEKTHFIQWGTKYKHEYIFDKINEWERLDSAGYSIPYNEDSVLVQSVYKTKNTLNSDRLSAYIMDSYTVNKFDVFESKLTFGVRGTYWTMNNQIDISPRAQYQFKPLKSKRDISYKVAAGLYYQPPFYREMRRLDGTVNKSVDSQKSIHIVGGLTWDFYLGNKDRKPFKFIAELYYKKLWDLISYEVDNVRIRYSGENDATGYVTGLDLRINGEFVPGAESWINLSFLRARESLTGIQHKIRKVGNSEGKDISDVPRPTDRFVTSSIFFQDYLRKNKNIKVHVNIVYGTGLPFGLKGKNLIFRNTYRYKPYHRVDIGFSMLLWDKTRLTKRPRHPLRFSRNSWISLEVYNLLNIFNEASKTWIKTIYGTQFAIPNHLTSRRVNLKINFDF